MATLILAAKLYIPPPRPKAVARPRLVERLNEGLSRAPSVSLICAPAGFGKTTLVSEWLDGTKRHEPPVRTAWLSLDEGDNDPMRFLAYLVAAVQTVAPNIGAGALAQLRSPQPPPTEAILTRLLNDLTALRDHFILVLDDYHVIDAQPVDLALSFLLDHLPPKLHLAITTREDPQLPLARLRARGQLTELRAADLRFTPAEAAEFLNPVMGLNLAEADIAALDTRTEGWIAGLQLAAISMRGQTDAARFIKSFTGTHHFVLDYLIEEVLQQQSAKVQIFLLRTSILDRLCGALCDAVLLDPAVNGQANLEYLQRANIFIVPLDNERQWYRYHHLFADLLRRRQEQNQAPTEIAQYHIRAGEWYAKNGDTAEAFRHLTAAGDFGRAAGLAETTWQTMSESFQSAAWLGWVKQLPEEIIASRPVLCTQMAWGFMNAYEVEASASRLRDAERCLEDAAGGMVIVDQEQFRILPARIAFARAYNAQTRGDFLSTVSYAELVFKLLPETHFLRAQTKAILAGTYWTTGDLEAAGQVFSDWIDNSQKVGNFFFAIAAASGQADILAAQGYLREAFRTLRQSLQLASTHAGEAQWITAPHYLGMALLHHEMGEDEAAAQNIHRSLELGERSTIPDWPYRRSIAQARLKESAGELDAALDLLDESKRFYIKTLIPYARPIEAIKARIYLKQGRLSKAEEWVSQYGLSVDDELAYLREFEHIILVRVLLAGFQSRRDERAILEALSLLERLLKAAEDCKIMGSVLEILVTQALVYQAQGSPSRACDSLERALTLAQPEGYVRIFVDEGDRMRSLLSDFRKLRAKQLRGNDPELTSYVDKLLSTFAQPKDRQQSKLVEPLSDRELEVLRLLRTELNGPEIASQLSVSLSTLRTHTQSIFGKLEANNRRAAVRRADELGL